MKHLLCFLPMILAALTAWAQGSGVISFSNINATDDRRIWTYENGALVRVPTGTGYSIALYWGRQGTFRDGLVQAGAPVSFGPSAGTFAGGNRTVAPLANNGDTVTVQARAWAVIPGVPNTYEAVLAAGLNGDPRACVGWGPVFDHDTARPGDPTDPPYSIGSDPGWHGFIICIPEPSTVPLATLAGAGLLLICRTKGARKVSCHTVTRRELL